MAENIFLSWSGPRSKVIAEGLRNWPPVVVLGAKPWMSETDVQKGKRWRLEIWKQLEACDVGIVCLTPENVSSPWLNFEAGAIAKRLDEGALCGRCT